MIDDDHHHHGETGLKSVCIENIEIGWVVVVKEEEEEPAGWDR